MGRVFFNIKKNIHTLNAAYSVLASDSGKTFIIDQSGGVFAVSLPDAAVAGAGWYCDFMVGTSSASAQTIIATDDDGDNIHALTFAQDDTHTQNTCCDVITVLASSEIGDSWSLFTDGTNWYVKGMIADNDHLAFT